MDKWIIAIPAISLAAILYLGRIWLKRYKRGGLGRPRRMEKCH